MRALLNYSLTNVVSRYEKRAEERARTDETSRSPFLADQPLCATFAVFSFNESGKEKGRENEEEENRTNLIFEFER